MISAVVFDLGRVLVDFSFDSFIQFIVSRGCVVSTQEEFIERTDMLAYEHGHFDTREFFSKINSLLSSPALDHEIAECWTGIFTPIPRMLDLLAAVRKKVPVYVLSNTGEMHLAYLRRTYELDSRADGVLASCEVGAMKPDPKIYHEAALRFSLDPDRTLFVDDRHENIVGAEAVGWKGIHHVSIDETVRLVHQRLLA